MATLAPAAKMRRVLELLMGLRDDRVLAALMTHGFTEQDRARGWDRLRGLGMTQAMAPPIPTGSPALSALDEWRGRWLGIARASLERDYPQVTAALCQRSRKTEQASLSVVGAFVTRFEKLERAKDEQSKAALDKLRQRGLSSERIKEGKRLVDEALRPKHVEAPDPELRRTAIRTERWDYFLEWGQIARAVIKSEHLLTLLGYRIGNADTESAQESGETETEMEAAETDQSTAVAAPKTPLKSTTKANAQSRASTKAKTKIPVLSRHRAGPRLE